MQNIWQAPTSTIVGVLICGTLLVMTAMFTGHDQFLSDLLKVLGGMAAGAGGAWRSGSQQTGS